MRKNRWLSSLYVWLVMLFLYAPIAVLIVFSFNDSKSRNTWTGFTLRWYEELFHDRVIIQSFVVMLVVAIASSVVATLLGTLAAIGLNKMNKKLKSVVMTFTYLPMINPEIITGVALMLLFIYLLYPKLADMVLQLRQPARPVPAAQAEGEFNPYAPIVVVPNDYQEEPEN